MNCNTRTVAVQACHNGGTYATGGTGDENNFVVKRSFRHGTIHKGFIAHMQYEAPATLPRVDDLSAEHSARVARFLRQKIAAAGGSISFAEFMHEALYAPSLGYYASGTTKLGSDGDFVTAPEISPVFGAVVARQCAEVLQEMKGGAVLELGAGSGRLAVDMLTRFESLGCMPRAYYILEISADLQDRQRHCLEQEASHLLDRVHWLSGLPESFDGVIVANEVLDALPVERFVRRDDRISQLRVSCSGQGFQWVEEPANERILAAVAEIEADRGAVLPNGYTSELLFA
ncbi:MAG TPA: SAM-dependent methyltransferase, partial [Woeseiaceae bacterium]|nr:SAM-dependent methyltransferase [Woeseiaceae bacterium]